MILVIIAFQVLQILFDSLDEAPLEQFVDVEMKDIQFFFVDEVEVGQFGFESVEQQSISHLFFELLIEDDG